MTAPHEFRLYTSPHWHKNLWGQWESRSPVVSPDRLLCARCGGSRRNPILHPDEENA